MLTIGDLIGVLDNAQAMRAVVEDVGADNPAYARLFEPEVTTAKLPDGPLDEGGNIYAAGSRRVTGRALVTYDQLVGDGEDAVQGLIEGALGALAVVLDWLSAVPVSHISVSCERLAGDAGATSWVLSISQHVKLKATA